MAAEELITFDELRSKLVELEETCNIARRERERLAARKERAEQLERDRDALPEVAEAALPEDLGALSGEERNRIGLMLQLEITPLDGKYRVRGVFCTEKLLYGPS